MPRIASESSINLDTAFLNDLDYKDEKKNAVINSAISLLRYKTIILVFFFAVTGFLLPDLYAHKYGFPVPHVHDEFSYLLAADTFANGSLSNPTPEFYEHFESPHLLMTPAYMSKFPPAQGLILALGQVIFGQPIYGVWISCGLLSAALFWMLSQWFGSRWAILGTAIMLFFVGTGSYWAQSFWGGSLAAFGGCIFFGSFRQLLNKLSLSGFLLLIFGGTIMINSRPFEGLLTMLPSLIFLLVRLVKDNAHTFPAKFRKFILPSFAATLVIISAMGYYNFRVTGSAFTFPYTIHQSQYFSTPLFIFQSPLQSEFRGTPRLQGLYNELSINSSLHLLENYNPPELKIARTVFTVLYLSIRLPTFLISLPLTVFLYLFLIPVIRKNSLLILIAGTILFTFAAMSAATYWEKCHYSASLTACFYLLLAGTFRYCSSFFKKDSRAKFIPVFIAVLSFFIFFDWLDKKPEFYYPTENPPTEIGRLDELKDGKIVSLKIYQRATYLKPEIENYFQNQPGKYLALVAYDEKQSAHDEIVFNKANIENSKFIWAYDLGEEKNANLVKHFGDRKIIYVNVSSAQIKLGFQSPENRDSRRN